MTVKKPVRATIALPLGRVSFPFFVKPDEGREYSDGAYKCDFLVPKEVWNAPHKTEKGKTKGQVVEEAVLKVAQDLTGDPKLKFKDIKKQPIKDLDLIATTDPKMKGYMMMRCKNKKFRPFICDVNKKELTKDEEIATIKGGDWCDLVVTCFSYSQSGGGVTFGLDMVRFVKKGEPFGSGAAKHLNLLDDIEVAAEDFTDEELEKLTKK